MQTLSHYAAAQRQRSTPQAPLQRLSAPWVLPWTSTSSDAKIVRIVTVGGKVANLDDLPSPSADFAWPYRVSVVAEHPGAIDMWLRDTTAAAIASGLEPAIAMSWRRRVKAASSVLGSPFVVSLADALDGKWWLPTDPVERTAFVRRAFVDVSEQISSVFSGTPVVPPLSGLVNPANTAVDRALTSRSANAEYRYVTIAGAMTAAYRAQDVIGMYEAMLTGETTLVTPFAADGAQVVATVDSQTKLKMGKQAHVLVPGFGGVGLARVDSFGMTSDGRMTVTLTGTLNAKTGTLRASTGLLEMIRAVTKGRQRSFGLFETPFTRLPNPVRRPVFLDRQAPPIVRDVPLAVSLAGALTR